MKFYKNIGNYLVHSYLYYVLNDPVISDHDYDAICKHLHDNWEQHKDHPHAHLITKEDLAAGTGYAIRNYPTIVKVLAHQALRYRDKHRV